MRQPKSSINLTFNEQFFFKTSWFLGLELAVDLNRASTKIKSVAGYKDYSRTVSASTTPFIGKYWNLNPFLLYASGGLQFFVNSSKTQRQLNNVPSYREKKGSFQFIPQTQIGILYPISNRIGVDVSARSSLLPIAFNELKVGLSVLSGGTNTSSSLIGESPLVKGHWTVSGTIGIKSESSSLYYVTEKGEVITTEDSNKSSYFAPSVGFFVANRLLIGATISLGIKRAVPYNFPGGIYYVVNNKTPVSIALQPYIKKYLLSSRLSPYLQGYIGWGFIKAGGPVTHTFYTGGDFGLAFSVSRHLLIESSLVGLNGGFSDPSNFDTDIATMIAPTKIHMDVKAGLKPAFTINYVFD